MWHVFSGDKIDTTIKYLLVVMKKTTTHISCKRNRVVKKIIQNQIAKSWCHLLPLSNPFNEEVHQLPPWSAVKCFVKPCETSNASITIMRIVLWAKNTNRLINHCWRDGSCRFGLAFSVCSLLKTVFSAS